MYCEIVLNLTMNTWTIRYASDGVASVGIDIWQHCCGCIFYIQWHRGGGPKSGDIQRRLFRV